MISPNNRRRRWDICSPHRQMWERVMISSKPSKTVTYAAVFDGSNVRWRVPTVRTVGYKYAVRFADYHQSCRSGQNRER